MDEKIEELAKEYNFIVDSENSHNYAGMRNLIKEAILYGRASALDEVEKGLKKYAENDIEIERSNRDYIAGKTQAFTESIRVISRIRSETSG